MYTLKIETDNNGFEYFNLPKHFKIERYTNKFQNYCNHASLILKNERYFKKEWRYPSLIPSDNTPGGIKNYKLPEIDEKSYLKEQEGKGCTSDSATSPSFNAIPIPIFKVITYTEDENNPVGGKCIVFNGKAYLIKEKGITIEKF